MFKKAIPVYAAGQDRKMNSHLLFRRTVDSLKKTELYIAAYSFYRLWVNGKFVFFGPSRAAGGYGRVEIIELSPYHADDCVNEIVIEVAGYACGSLATVDQPSYLAAELRREDQVLFYTGRDFSCFDPGLRVQKVERYSVQRHFGEVWDYRDYDPFAEKNRVPVVPVQTQLQWLPSTPKPCFACEPAKEILSTGTFVQGEAPKKNNSYSWAEIPVEWGYFPEEEITTFPYRWIRSQKMMLSSGKQDFPVTLREGSYALMDMEKIWCGFLELGITALEDTVLVVGFSELCEKETFTYTNINMQNVIEYTFPAGMDTTVLSFEPYTCRHCVVMVKKGALKVNHFGIRRYDYDTARILPRNIKDPELCRIYHAAVRSFCHNVLDIYMDCPSRERAGWLCDSYFMGKVEYFLTGETAVEDAYLENYRLHTGKGKLPEGILPECYPSDFEGNFIPQWNLWYILEVYEHLTQRNKNADKELFRKSIYGILVFMKQYENQDGLLEKLPSWNFVEWSKANSWVQDINYPTNFLYARALQCTAELYDDDALASQAEQLRKTTREKSFNGEIFIDNAKIGENGAKNTENFSEAGQYYAILFGGVDLNDPKYAKLQSYVLNGFANFDSNAENYVPVNMFIGYFLRLMVLMQLNRKDLLSQNIKQKFLPMIDLTDTLWEYNFQQRNGSYDHGFSSFAAIAAVLADQEDNCQIAQK